VDEDGCCVACGCDALQVHKEPDPRHEIAALRADSERHRLDNQRLQAERERLTKERDEIMSALGFTDTGVAEAGLIGHAKLIERATAFQRSMAAEADFQRRRNAELDAALAEIERLRRVGNG
jgi:hypothetical protein